MSKKILFFTACMILFLAIGIVHATRCPPYQFYGFVTINGFPAPDGTSVVVRTGNDVAGQTITRGGWYNKSLDGQNVFYVTEPNCDSMGEKCLFFRFYLKGVYVNESHLCTLETKKVDLSLETECGNDICEAGEDHENCCDDCGCPSGYYCDSNQCIEETDEGGNRGRGGGSYVPPSEESFCGDDICDENETCSNCEQDCGSCPPECYDSSDCDDDNDCTIDNCDEGSCVYSSVGCIDNDSCCPSGCNFANDNDCDSTEEPMTGGQTPGDNNGGYEPLGSELGQQVTGMAAIPSEVMQSIPVVLVSGSIIAGVFYVFYWRKK